MNNKLKLMCMVLGTCLIAGTAANAAQGELGTVNFKKIATGYNYAKNVSKEIDDEILKLNQYLLDKEKELKALESPIAQKNFGDKITREYKIKEDALKIKQNKVDIEVTNRIMNAIKIISQQKSIDTVFDYRVVVVGGKDITDDVLNYLNAQPQSKSSVAPQVQAAPIQQQKPVQAAPQRIVPAQPIAKEPKTKSEAKDGGIKDIMSFGKRDKQQAQSQPQPAKNVTPAAKK